MPPKAKNKSIVKNFKKGRMVAKNKNKTLSTTSTNVKKSHGKVGGNITYTGKKILSVQSSDEREAIKERILARRLARETLDAGGPKVVLPSDFKEKKHLSLADELANLDDSGSEIESDPDSEVESDDLVPETPVVDTLKGRNKSIRSMLKSNHQKNQLSESEEDTSESENTMVPRKTMITKKKDDVDKQFEKDIVNEDGNGAQKKKGSRGVLADKMTEKHVQMSIKILKRLDPDQKLGKDKLMGVLEALQDKSEDLLIVETCGFLLESLENMEEKLEEAQIIRSKQEKKLKAKRIDGKVFKMKISLDLGSDEEPEPDENDRIYCTGKKIYSGKHSLYLKPDKEKKKEILKKIKPQKMNAKMAQKYNLT